MQHVEKIQKRYRKNTKKNSKDTKVIKNNSVDIKKILKYMR
jgi:hypothetical protein